MNVKDVIREWSKTNGKRLLDFSVMFEASGLIAIMLSQINWSFLEPDLLKMGLTALIIGLIMEVIGTAMYLIPLYLIHRDLKHLEKTLNNVEKMINDFNELEKEEVE